MSDSEVKLVKVDNWGIYFLQRLKHFFNRTDYCDLTLQFQDNAQLKVHRLVLSACTEYFELLERTCEMYEDCLVMPDDLQADVVVPIVNFMYTGQLEFKMDLLERLYQTSQVMNMPVLTKLLDAHRSQAQKPALNYNSIKRSYSKSKDPIVKQKQTPVASSSCSSKRSFNKAFGSAIATHKENKKPAVTQKIDTVMNNGLATPYVSPGQNQVSPSYSVSRKVSLRDPRPTRYELPEELDTDNVFDNSFSSISYTSQPLMVHPETTKHYQPKRSGLFGESSRKLGAGTSTLDIIECRKMSKNDNIFEDDNTDIAHDDMFQIKEPSKTSNQLFDQIIEQNGPKVTIETKDNKQAGNIDHAKIISEVLKKYPHLVKSNKNIKLKILNTPNSTPNKSKGKKQRNSPNPYSDEKAKTDVPDFTYESDVLDSKEAARLIAMGAENIKGPWICLICGTPGRALHFTSYYKFRCHLVEVHNEKPVSNMCEYCGLKSPKRRYLLHHLLTKHGVEPPPSHQFPKCNVCSYVALTEGFLVKHKLTHSDNANFRCNVCAACYKSSAQLLSHIQRTGHKYSADRKTNLQCVYCMKMFLREGNLYAHLKTYHKQSAKADGIIDDSDEEQLKDDEEVPIPIKYEPQSFKTEYDDVETQYQIRPDGNIELVSNVELTPRKPRPAIPTPTKQKILNSGFEIEQHSLKPKPVQNIPNVQDDYNEEIVMIDNNEYIMRDNQLILNNKKRPDNEYILSDMMTPEDDHTLTPSTSMDYSNIQTTVSEENFPQKIVMKKAGNINQPIQIVVSNEEEYKALMNSNHSIIFDDGEANKTLTVLSTPHSSTLNTATLDLDNTQSNDMMIIQDNYPLTASEALPTQNSNIVVVYSHAVGDQNKQYQLITPQDIGAQFVQSSAVITQNFETITTSTPIMNTHVIDPHVAGPWQSNEHIGKPSEVQEMTIVEPTVIVPTEAPTETDSHDNTLSELPEVTLTPAETQEDIPQENESEEYLNQPSDVATNETVNYSEEAVIESNVSASMDVDISTEAVIDDTTNADLSIEEPIPNNIVLEDAANTEIKEAQVQDEVQDNEQLTDQSVITEHENIEIQEQTEINTETETSIDPETGTSLGPEIETSLDPEVDKVDIAEIRVAQEVPETNDQVTLPKVSNDQIQSLTSEWSEDEYDIEEQEQIDDRNMEKNEEEENVTSIPPHEVEESIENIQQEMNKQMAEASETETMTEIPESETMTEIPESETMTKIQETDNLEDHPVPQLSTEAPIEKISSLLNDWDENDSQEGNESVNDNEDNDDEPAPEASESIANESKEGEAAVDKLDPKKDDKIQRLVSDWDDDDDEGKH